MVPAFSSDAHSMLLAIMIQLQAVMMVHVSSLAAPMRPHVIMIVLRDATMQLYALSHCSPVMMEISLQ
jgi:hypothetical protein